MGLSFFVASHPNLGSGTCDRILKTMRLNNIITCLPVLAGRLANCAPLPGPDLVSNTAEVFDPLLRMPDPVIEYPPAEERDLEQAPLPLATSTAEEDYTSGAENRIHDPLAMMRDIGVIAEVKDELQEVSDPLG